MTAVEFYYEHFGRHLPVVVRNGNTITGVFPRKMSKVYIGYCAISNTPNTEVVQINRNTDGVMTIDWRLLSGFAQYERNENKTSRFQSGVVALFGPSGVWMTRDVVGTNFTVMSHRDMMKMLVDGFPSPYMILYFSDSTARDLINLRIVHSSDIVDLSGSERGFIKLNDIRALLTSGAIKKDMMKWRKSLSKGDIKSIPDDAKCISGWTNNHFRIFYSQFEKIGV